MQGDNGPNGQSSFPEFELSNEFRALHAEAHRRYPEMIEPPFLTWHIVTSLTERFDSDRSLDGRAAASSQEASRASMSRRQAEIDRVNAFICSVTGEGDRVIEIGKLAGDRLAQPYITRDVITKEGPAISPHLVFRCEYHQEYVSYCFFLPIRHPLKPPRGDDSDDTAVTEPAALSGRPFNNSNPAVDDLVRDLYRRTLVANEEENDLVAVRARTAKEWDQLYDKAWQIALQDTPDDVLHRIPGKVLGNFRGVILPRIWMVNTYGADEAGIHEFEWRGHRDRFIPTDIEGEPRITGDDTPKHHVHERNRPSTPRRWNRVSAGRCLRDNHGLRHALHWPGGEPKEPDSRDPLARRRTVANLVLNGRALYASALAPPLPTAGLSPQVRTGEEFNHVTSRYCIFYCEEHAGRAQDGISARLDRLVLRLHNLANNRLMALRGLDKVPGVKQNLDWIDRRLSELEDEAGTDDPLEIRDIKALYRELTLATSSDAIFGGLMMRAAQSERYASAFKRIIPSLHIHRIEGWEPYDMFMSRKLYGMFDNIQALGTRAESLRRRLDRIVEIAQLEAGLSATKASANAAKATLWLTAAAVVLTVLGLANVFLGPSDQSDRCATGCAVSQDVPPD